MGIPSYYKRLVDIVAGLVSKTHPGSIDWLWMDFNCLIYHCLRRPDTPAYPGETGRSEWEKEFIECVCKYMLHVVREVKPKKGVYIAIDGVVPMAKMRQQRLRRFKSAWLTQNGLNEGHEAGKEVWDTNAITPGTEFMAKLRTRLEKVCTTKTTSKMRFVLSSSDEPGEGEHKLMEQWRDEEHSGTKDVYAVYGLDADLIVLSILNRGDREVWLFREQIESGVVMRDAVGDEFYCWLSMPVLSEYIQSQIGKRSIQEYCFAMSVLGNDFLPSSLSFKMREDGHDALLECLQGLKVPLLEGEGASIYWPGVRMFMEWLASGEEARVSRFVGRKLAMAKNYCANLEGGALPLGDNNWPLSQAAESVLLEGRDLRPDWSGVYYRRWLGGVENTAHLCEQYLYGIQWIWAYYMGRADQICFNWFYPEGLPPLWKDIVDYMRSEKSVVEFPGEIKIQREDIQPVEQLCLVLPLESWGLLPFRSKERGLIERAPWLFPSSFGFGSIGKRYFWECEAEIPVPSIAEVKAILA